jgi:hypothetical protein
MAASAFSSLSGVAPARGEYTILSSAAGTENLLRPLQLSGPLAHAHAPQKRDIELGIDPAVEITTGRGDAALPLEHPKMMRRDPQTPGSLRNVELAHTSKLAALRGL